MELNAVNNTDMISKIKELIDKSGKNFANEFRKKENKRIFDWIYANCPEKLKDKRYKLSTILFWILNNMTDFPECGNPLCRNKVGEGTNIRFFEGYSKYCRKCAKNSDEARELRKKTCIEKYGVENPFQSKDVIDKIANTNMKKYGCRCPLTNSEIKKKTDNTRLRKYGITCYQKTEDYKNKVRETCLRKYGKGSVLEVEEIRDKIKKTMLEKYGVEHNSQSEHLRKKSSEHLKEKYGENYRQILWGGKGNKGQSKRAYSFILMSECVEPMFTLDEYIKGKEKNINTKFKFRCKKCGTEFTSPWDNGKSNKCPNCNVSNGTSDIEKEMVDFIRKSCKCKVSTNDRTLISPYELDAVLYDRKICFEMDGLYWHCDEMNKNHNYHVMKTEMCEKLGFQLIHIFENEWKYKNTIVKSRIRNLLGLYDHTTYARKCTVKTISGKEARDFILRTHIQGYCPSRVNLGLYDGDKLVSVMTFGKSRFNRKYEWELLRFCNELGYHVIGGAGKLLKYFERNYNPKSLISYADRRWSKGNLYLNLGFKSIGNSKPNYWYIDFGKLMIYSRVRFQKHNLGKILKEYDETLSEVENMKNNGYGRIFDCGNVVFTKEYDNAVV